MKPLFALASLATLFIASLSWCQEGTPRNDGRASPPPNFQGEEKERLRKLEPCCCKVEGLKGPARPTTTGHCESIDYEGLDAPLKGRCETNLNVTRVDCPDKDKRIFRFCKGNKETGGNFADKWLPDVLDVANACLFTPPDTSSSSSSSSNAVTSSSSSSPAVPRSGSSSNSSRSSSSSSSGLSR